MSSCAFKGLTALAVSTSLLAFSAPAFAQLDEIVVTAQKREQSLQDVPISINAFDLESIEKNRISGLEDIAKFSPGVYTTPNPADETGVRVNIRGIGTFDPQIGQDSRTAIYLDGVYYGRSQGLAFDSPDLGRVEILKGPQGTLYGRNSVGGAVNIISVAPDAGEFSGGIDGEFGNFDYRKVKGHINVPIGENAALRVSGLYSDVDGWVENTGAGENFGATERLGGRAALRFEPNDSLTFDVAADYTNTQSTPLFHQALPGTANPTSLFAAAITPGPDGSRQESVSSFAPIEFGETEIFGVSGIANYSVNETDDLKLTLAYRQADSNRFVSLAPTANPLILGGIINADVSPAAGLQSFNSEFTALPAAFETARQVSGQPFPLRADFASQFDGSLPADTGLFLSGPGGASTLNGHEQFSAELTYTGEFSDGDIQYTAGLFYFDEQTGNDGGNPPNQTDANSFLFVLGGLGSVLGATGFNAGIAPTQGGIAQIGAGIAQLQGALAQIPDVPATAAIRAPLLAQLAALQAQQAQLQGTLGFLQNGVVTNVTAASSFLAGARQSAANTLSIDTQAFAIYGEATWHVTDDFRITGGLRYSDDRKDGVGQAVSPFFLDNIDLLGNVIAPNIGEADTDSLDPSVVLEYDASDDVLLYASYKESFRSGGFNAAAVGLIPPGETAGADFVFGQEDITAYEVGFKSDLGDNRLRLNLAGYFYDFKDFQTTVSLDPLIATSRAIVNTDQEIWGIDLEAVFAFNENLTTSLTYAYVDGNTDDTVNPGTGVIDVRDELQGTPQNSVAVSFDYNQPLSNNLDFFANATYSYKDGALAIPMQGAADEIRFSDQDLLSGRIGVGFDVGGRDISVSLWGENLTDDEYTIDGLPFNTFAFNTAVFGSPRTYGIAAGVRF